MQKNILRVFPLILYSCVIYYLSSLESEKLPEEYFISFFTAVHFIEYFIYGMLTNFAFHKNPKVLSILIGVFYGGFDEYHQSFVPTRTPDYWDFIVDILGVIAGVYFISFLRRKLYERRN